MDDTGTSIECGRLCVSVSVTDQYLPTLPRYDVMGDVSTPCVCVCVCVCVRSIHAPARRPPLLRIQRPDDMLT